MTLAGSLLKKALKTDIIILWQSLRPVSIKLVLWKLLFDLTQVRHSQGYKARKYHINQTCG